jgi:DNA invertase Pin-like site-specific DNA recombinase
MKYTIAKYLRISAEDIDLDGFDKYESNSIQNQRALLDDFICRIPEFAGCEITEELDDGRTGVNFQRPGVQRLIELAKSGKVQCIVVKDLSRWGRNYLEVGDWLEQLFPSWGVRFISVNDAYDSAKLNGGTGGIDIAFRNLVYEMYSQDLSEKVRSAKFSAAKSGKYSNAEAFYGYIKDPNDPRKLAIDDPAAEVVRRVFDLTARGFTPNQIAKIFNDESIPTPQERKRQNGSRHRYTSGDATFWYGSVISLFIRDERYTGKLIYGKTKVKEVRGRQHPTPKEDWVVVPGAIPAIVTEEQYGAANANASKRRKGNPHRPPTTLIFSGKIRCAHCGMNLKTIHRAHDVKYYCETRRLTDKYACIDFRLFEKDVAAIVLAALRQQIAFADDARKLLERRHEQLTPSIEEKRGEADRLQKLIEKSKTVKMSLWEKYRNGGLTAEAFQRENESADGRVKRHAEKIAALESEIRSLETETGRENVFVERFGKQLGITELTREVVEEFISEVKVYSPERIEVVFNYADGYEEIARLTEAAKTKRRGKK